MTISGISNVVLISLSSFFDFGYFRIYEAFLHRYPESFFADEEWIQIERSGKIRPDFLGSFYTRSFIRDPVHLNDVYSDILLKLTLIRDVESHSAQRIILDWACKTRAKSTLPETV
jgi:hypothetical protein